MTEESIFAEALAVTDVAERAAYLERACGGDAALRAAVEALLAAHGVGSPLDQPPVSLAKTGPFVSRTALAGDRVGPYKLLEQVGEGGMGEVWMADQSEPVKRRVALKLIKPGMDTRSVLARFEAERQALALMDHPNIAKVFDAGATADGRPYFVMELVKGVPITKYCDEKRLNPRERLELFVQACQAIQHAHQKGIIHRDVKPSNVLVALYDDKPVVKVIDFGVAKATGQPLTDKTLATGFGAVVGTPQYMSPEQATLNNLDIDTRSDVYSLGVLLYELLAGSPPFSRKELEQQGLMEILRVVREEEPPRPSTKLSTADALPSLSANRNTEPRQLTALLRGELDWIVMKALEKDRPRRYETANGFAADVLRFLAGEPVLAHPPSTGYRLKKFVRKNRPQVIAVGLIAFVFLAGLAGTVLGFFQAEAGRREAERAWQAEANRAEAEKEARAAEALRAEGERLANEAAQRAKNEALAAAAAEKKANQAAQQRAEQLVANNKILLSIFRDLNFDAIRQEGEPLEAVLAKGLMTASKQLNADTVGDPVVAAFMLGELGHTLIDLGYSKEAIPVLEQAHATLVKHVGGNAGQTVEVMTSLALAYRESGQHKNAIELYQRIYAIRRDRDGPKHHGTMSALNNLAMGYKSVGRFDLAIPHLEECVAAARANPKLLDRSFATRLSNLAGVYQDSGQYDKALPLYKEALEKAQQELPADHPTVLLQMQNLATCYHEAGQREASIELLRKVRSLMLQRYGREHPVTNAATGNLGTILLQAKEWDEGIKLIEEAHQRNIQKWGELHTASRRTLQLLAEAYVTANRTQEAVRLADNAWQRAKDANDPDMHRYIRSRAKAYLADGKIIEAIKFYQEALTLSKTKFGEQHSATLKTQEELAEAYRLGRRPDLAEKLFREILTHRERNLGAKHRSTNNARAMIGVCLSNMGRFDEAIVLLEETLRQEGGLSGKLDVDRAITLGNLANCYMDKGDWQRALPLLEKNRQLLQDHYGPTHRLTLIAMDNLAAGYYRAGRRDQSMPLVKETFQLMEKHLGKNHHDTLSCLNNLAFTSTDGNDRTESIRLFEELLQRKITAYGEKAPSTLSTKANLGLTYILAKQIEKGIPLLEDVLAHGKNLPNFQHIPAELLMAYLATKQTAKALELAQQLVRDDRERLAKDSQQLAAILTQRSMLFQQLNAPEEAEKLLREAYSIREKQQPDAWSTFNTQSMLGSALLGQKKYSEAEPLLLKGYEGMKEREKTIPPQAKGRIPEALDRLIELYTATKKPDEVKKYRELRAKYPATLNAPPKM